ncbi:ArsR/SmtB family transcription factor [Planctobacterium marinum]
MDIFQAMADPTRRNIIERLSSYQAAKTGLSIKELTADTGISRQAVTKHLNVLVKSGAVKAEFKGKEKRHFLKHYAFSGAFQWLAPIAEEWDERLIRLKQHLNKGDIE